MKRNVTFREIIIATLTAGLTAWFAYGWLGFAFMLGAALIGFLAARYAMRLLPGLTGDIYGTVTTLVEMLTLTAFTAIHPS
jgi:cobalamin synthase